MRNVLVVGVYPVLLTNSDITMAILPSIFYIFRYTKESKEKHSMDRSALIGAFIIYIIIVLAGTAFSIFVMWRILSRAGYSGGLSFLMLIPGIGALIIFLMLAFGDWPALRELNMLRQ